MFLLLGLFAACCGPTSGGVPSEKTMPDRDINAVLRDHQADLMAIPGVVGVYVGLADDGKTNCLKVMVSNKTRDLVQEIPKSLEGYPVFIEETGVIRPLRQKGENM